MESKLCKCPCCWEDFSLDELLWISEAKGITDPWLANAKEKARRFYPKHFTIDHRPIDIVDDKSVECKRRFACPKCHLEIPEQYLESKPFIVSIVGPQQSGKTYFLVSLHHWLCKRNYDDSIVFESIETSNNEILNKRCEKFFPRLIDSGKKQADTSKKRDSIEQLGETKFGENSIVVTHPTKGIMHYPNPFMYSIIQRNSGQKYTFCLYDHSGEEYKRENVEKLDRIPITKYIGRSDALFFLFDPTQYPSCVKEYKKDWNEYFGAEKKLNMEEPDMQGAPDAIFQTLKNVIKSDVLWKDKLRVEHENLEKYNRPLYIVVSKCDAWKHCLSKDSQKAMEDDCETLSDQGLMEYISDDVEAFIDRHCPEFTKAVRAFSADYMYIPVSATGKNPDVVYSNVPADDGGTNRLRSEGYEPDSLSPIWISLPFTYALWKHKDQIIFVLSNLKTIK